MNNELIVGIINIGYGNISPIINILKRSYIMPFLVQSPNDLKNCHRLIIPGVGTFDNFMHGLKSAKLDNAIIDYAHSNKPVLGICVGAQIMGKESEEGKHNGLNLINMKIKKFDRNLLNNLPVPHIGWNTLTIVKSHSLLENLSKDHRFYFAHSYHFEVEDDSYLLSNTSYGYDFCSIAGNQNIIAVQFHPEKSHDYGFKILQNFCLL
ncbi:MAG: imidazole glycerol phosphate synthase subunit HisH [Gammaproteobacteria bacterium]